MTNNRNVIIGAIVALALLILADNMRELRTGTQPVPPAPSVDPAEDAGTRKA